MPMQSSIYFLGTHPAALMYSGSTVSQYMITSAIFTEYASMA